MALLPKVCAHLLSVEEIKSAPALVCEACVRVGGQWVHLRTCQHCGTTLCCDSSPLRHAREHFQQTGHPVVASAEPGDRWLWCYPDELFTDY